jgi:hypoxanthine phosphoribosyltransferase
MGTKHEMQVLLTRTEIAAGVRRLAVALSRDYTGKNPLLVGVLRGAFVFLSDLVRGMDIPVKVDFVAVESYKGTQTTGRVQIAQKIRLPIEGKHVVVVEDIVDTGRTTTYVLRYLARRKPASLRVCALLDKPSRREIQVPIDYLGFTVPDKFLVGYGLDWNQEYRNLPDICVVDERK